MAAGRLQLAAPAPCSYLCPLPTLLFACFNPFVVGSIAFSLELAANLLFILLSLAIWLLPCSCSSCPPLDPASLQLLFVYGVWRKRLKRNLFSRPRGSSSSSSNKMPEIRNATKMRRGEKKNNRKTKNKIKIDTAAAAARKSILKLKWN